MAKVAVFFPGIGYNIDRPLLYYSRKLASEMGYEIVTVDYSGFPSNIRGDEGQMLAAFNHGLCQAETILSKMCWNQYEEVLFISKSIGTAVATAYAIKNDIKTRNVYFTPLAQTFMDGMNHGIAFTGTSDPWVENEEIRIFSERKSIPLYVYDGANHSLETDNTVENISVISDVMEKVKAYIEQ